MSKAAPLVEIRTQDTGILLDIRYATADNFMKTAVYPDARCFFVRETAERLVRVQQSLKPKGYGLKVWDCYRPLSVQKKLWAIVPDAAYVAPPAKGSRHNRGAAVDLTLVDAAGKDVEMPTGFDEFSQRAHRDYKQWTPAAQAHYRILDDAMTAAGFVGLPEEWWHYDEPDWKDYPVMDVPFPR